jgi:glycolate oxidase
VRVRNLAISEAAAPLGLYYAPDPSSQIACTIGGNVAENSGGVHCLKYGLTVHNVLKVRGFTVEGDPVEFGSDASTRPAWTCWRCWSAARHAGRGHRGHGQAHAQAPAGALHHGQLRRRAQAGDAVAAIIAAGIIPAGLEMMDKPMTAAVEDFVHAGYDLDAEAILLCESDGTPEEVEEEIGRMRRCWPAPAPPHGGQPGRGRAPALLERAQERLPGLGPHQPRLHVHGLDHPAQAPGRHPAGHPGDGEEVPAALRNVFHAGDGNLHPLILFDANDPDQLHRCELFGADILETSVAMGGTVTGEHGVGVEKLNSMCVQFSPEERAQMFAVKAAFDPAGLLNPGKVPHAAPLRRIRPHACEGPAALPELERF